MPRHDCAGRYLTQIGSLPFWFIALIGALGCSDPATFIGDACEPDVALTVGTTAPPEFRWAPDCSVGNLFVTTEAGDLMWSISSEPEADFTPTNQIRSGVTYGTLPAKARQSGEFVPLERGQTYRILLSVTDSHGDRTEVGSTTFSAPAE